MFRRSPAPIPCLIDEFIAACREKHGSMMPPICPPASGYHFDAAPLPRIGSITLDSMCGTAHSGRILF